mgnify:CR=1 FL=1
MNLIRNCLVAILISCQATWAIPGVFNAKDEWMQSLPRQCMVKKQSDFNHEIAVEAEKGNPDAQYQLGLALLLGEGLPKDTPLAFRWVSRAAQHNQVRAQSLLGSLYLHGEGVQASPIDAAYWYKKAAKSGDEDAQYALALMLRRGEGIPMNKAKAHDSLVALANNDYPAAQAMLGEWLLGHAKKDPLKMQEAVTWLKRSEGHGNEYAKYLLILAHIQYSPHEPLSESQIQWLTHLANEGNADKLYLLGMIYRYGVGVHQNFDLAKEYLQKSADRGNESAVILLGTFQQ